jgi:hypothetical protein
LSEVVEQEPTVESTLCTTYLEYDPILSYAPTTSACLLPETLREQGRARHRIANDPDACGDISTRPPPLSVSTLHMMWNHTVFWPHLFSINTKTKTGCSQPTLLLPLSLFQPLHQLTVRSINFRRSPMRLCPLSLSLPVSLLSASLPLLSLSLYPLFLSLPLSVSTPSPQTKAHEGVHSLCSWQ